MRNYEMYQIVKGMVEEIIREHSSSGKKSEAQNQQAYLTVEEAAQELNIKVSRLRTAIFRKEIPYIKIGSLVRIPRDELHEHLNKAISVPKSPLEC